MSSQSYFAQDLADDDFKFQLSEGYSMSQELSIIKAARKTRGEWDRESFENTNVHPTTLFAVQRLEPEYEAYASTCGDLLEPLNTEQVELPDYTSHALLNKFPGGFASRLLFQTGKYFTIIRTELKNGNEKDSVNIVARCVHCHKDLRGWFSVNSNFLKHLRKMHFHAFTEFQKRKEEYFTQQKMVQERKAPRMTKPRY